MKKFIIIIVLILSCFLVGCELFNPHKNEPQYKIYEMVKEVGYDGTYEEWLNTIRGIDGTSIVKVELDNDNNLIITLSNGVEVNCGNLKDDIGKSAYEIYKEKHPEYTKSEDEWLDDLVNGRLVTKEIHIVKFITNTEEIIEDQKVEDNKKIIKPNDPEKEGYTFIGWFTTTDKKIVFDDYNVKSDVTLYAKYTPNKYKITLDSETIIEVEYDSSFTLPVIEKEGYNFAGWYYNDELIESGIWQIPNDCNLVSKWTICEYHIYYELNGGTNNDLNPNIYTYETNDIVFVAPTKSGYTFIGWTSVDYLEPTIDLILPSKSTQDRTITAHWKVNTYIITYDVNGGNELENNVQTVIYDDKYELIVPIRTGYKFIGWYYENEKMENNGEQWNIAINITLKAKWQTNSYTITIIGNNGSINYDVDYESTFNLSVQYKNNYNFEGYYLEQYGQGEQITDLNGNSTNPYTYNYNITVYASYTYYVNFIANGGNEVETVIYHENECLDNNILTTKNGKTFDGWFTDEMLSSPVSYLKSLGNITLYAKWMEEVLPTEFIYETFQNSVTITGSTYDGTDLIIPSHIGGKLVIVIEENSFKNTSQIKIVEIPETVRIIEQGAFSECNLVEKITLPSIGDGKNNTHLGCIFDSSNNVPSSLKEVIVTVQTCIPERAFENCDMIERITLPNTVVSIGKYAFRYCHELKRLNSDEDGVFNIPELVTIINAYTFQECHQVIKFTMGQVESIGEFAFMNCNLVEYFNSETQYKMEIPKSVKTIDGVAFNGMLLIKEVYIPETLESIGEGVFIRFNSLEKITLPFIGYGDYPSPFQSIFSQKGVPSSLKEVIVTVQTNIPENAFANCDSIESITLPKTVESIGQNAFYNCKGLKRLNSEEDGVFNIPELVKIINDYTFYECNQAIKFTMGQVETVGSYAFYGITLITEVYIPETVQSIGEGAFKGCNSIEKITLPFIGSKENDTSVDSQTLGHIFGHINKSSSSFKTSNSDYTYQGRSYSYYIPKSLKEVTITMQTSIPERSFYNCDLIETITFLKTLEYIGENAFYNCNATTNYIYNPSMSVEWDGLISDSFHSGSGTYNDPYIIFTASEFAYFANQINNCNSYDNTYFKLTSNIRLGNKEFYIIGSIDNPFNGHLNGSGFIIKDFSISCTNNYTGLFGYVNGTIENVGIENATINANSSLNGNYYTGIIAYLGENGIVRNCYSTGTITNNATYFSYAGGLVGYSCGLIENSYSSCKVIAKSTSILAYAGGLVGYLEGTIKYSFATGSVTANGVYDTYSKNGGLVGDKKTNSNIIDSYRLISQELIKKEAIGKQYNKDGITNTIENIIESLKPVWNTNWNMNKIMPILLKGI
ncbi:MAG: leucine-rich repeat protein [Bacilli bacterium]|nr:leucine-rich repeat protein [Bacilli bacterium]